MMITHSLTRIDLMYALPLKGTKADCTLYRGALRQGGIYDRLKARRNRRSFSESTVVRFATELGYDGYPKLQKAMQEMIRNKLTSVQRIEVTLQPYRQ